MSWAREVRFVGLAAPSGEEVTRVLADPLLAALYAAPLVLDGVYVVSSCPPRHESAVEMLRDHG